MEITSLITWFLTEVISVIMNTTFLNNALLILFVATFLYYFKKESDNPNSTLSWIDMLLDKSTNRLSLTKIGQAMGMAISTWIMIFLVQMVKPDQVPAILVWMFPIWLGFIGGTWAWSSYIKSKPKKDDNES